MTIEDYVKKAVQYFQKKFNCLCVSATNDRTWAEPIFSNLINFQYVFTGIDSAYKLVPTAIALMWKRCVGDEVDSP